MTDTRYFKIAPEGPLAPKLSDWLKRWEAAKDAQRSLLASVGLAGRCERVFIGPTGDVTSFAVDRDGLPLGKGWRRDRHTGGLVPNKASKEGKELAALMAACPAQPDQREAAKWIGYPSEFCPEGATHREMLSQPQLVGYMGGDWFIVLSVAHYFRNGGLSDKAKLWILTWPVPEGAQEVTAAEYYTARQRDTADD